MKMIAMMAAASLALSSGALAQSQTAGSSSGTPADRDVRASTYGSGTSTPDGVSVSGGGHAVAEEGGVASVESSAKFNNNRARQRSTATARDDDERARSRTTTTVRRNGEVRSRSMSIYKERGERAVIDREVSTSGR
jgi:hypothetical protein